MKKKSKIVALLLAFLLVLSAFNVSDVYAASAKVSRVVAKNAITGKKAIVVAKGRTIKIKTSVTVKPNKSANKKVIYKSQNTKIATVSKSGVVKGVKAGKTKILVISKVNKKKKAVIKVTVKKTAVKSVKIKKPSSTTIYAGSTLKLSATAKGPKTANRTLFWSSNKPGIAKVSQKGLVTAVKVGTVKITAEATDGSNKKSTVTLKVVKKPAPKPVAVNIVAASVVNAQTVRFSLSSAKKLNPADISVMTKRISTGSYKYKLTIDNIVTNDNKNYTVILSDSSRIALRMFVLVNIPSLTGVKSKQVQFNEPVTSYNDERIVRLSLNQSVNSYYEDDEGYYYDSFGLVFEEAEGYYSQTISGLPAGIKYRVKDNRLYLYGAPTKVGVFIANYSAVDEVGNKLTRKVKFIVGSKTAINAGSRVCYGIASESTKYAYISTTGGSGGYNYNFAPGSQTYNCYIEGNEVYGVFDIPGTYNIKVTVTDAENNNIKTTVTVTFVIRQGIVLSGIVTDMSGNPIPNASVNLVNKNKADMYTSEAYVQTDSKGTFSAYLNPGTYDVEASYSGGSSDNAKAKRYLYSQKLVATKSGYDIKLPLYKVKFSLPKGVTSGDVTENWKDVYGDTYGYGDSIYVKKGTYTLTSKAEGGWYSGITGKLTSKFTVSNAAVFAPTTFSSGGSLVIKGNISLASGSATINGSSNNSYPYYVIYKLVADYSGYVSYQDNKNKDDIEIDVYDSTQKNYNVSGMDESGTFYVNKGDTYLIRVSRYSDYNSQFTYGFTLSKSNDYE